MLFRSTQYMRMNHTGRPTFHKPIKAIQVIKENKAFTYTLNDGLLEKDDKKIVRCTISETMSDLFQQKAPCQNNNGLCLLPESSSSINMPVQEEFTACDNGFESSSDSFFSSYDVTSTIIGDDFGCFDEGLFDSQFDNDFP